MVDDDGYSRITLRIPAALHGRLTGAARDKSRSTNAEIIDRLEAAASSPVGEKPEGDAERIERTIRGMGGSTEDVIEALNFFLKHQRSIVEDADRRSINSSGHIGTFYFNYHLAVFLQMRLAERRLKELQV